MPLRGLRLGGGDLDLLLPLVGELVLVEEELDQEALLEALPRMVWPPESLSVHLGSLGKIPVLEDGAL